MRRYQEHSGACLAHRNTFIHATNALTVLGAFGADLSAFVASVPVVRGVEEYEMCGCKAHFGTGHHQAKVSGLDVLSPVSRQ